MASAKKDAANVIKGIAVYTGDPQDYVIAKQIYEEDIPQELKDEGYTQKMVQETLNKMGGVYKEQLVRKKNKYYGATICIGYRDMIKDDETPYKKMREEVKEFEKEVNIVYMMQRANERRWKGEADEAKAKLAKLEKQVECMEKREKELDKKMEEFVNEESTKEKEALEKWKRALEENAEAVKKEVAAYAKERETQEKLWRTEARLYAAEHQLKIVKEDNTELHETNLKLKEQVYNWKKVAKMKDMTDDDKLHAWLGEEMCVMDAIIEYKNMKQEMETARPLIKKQQEQLKNWKRAAKKATEKYEAEEQKTKEAVEEMYNKMKERQIQLGRKLEDEAIGRMADVQELLKKLAEKPDNTKERKKEAMETLCERDKLFREGLETREENAWLKGRVAILEKQVRNEPFTEREMVMHYLRHTGDDRDFVKVSDVARWLKVDSKEARELLEDMGGQYVTAIKVNKKTVNGVVVGLVEKFPRARGLELNEETIDRLNDESIGLLLREEKETRKRRILVRLFHAKLGPRVLEALGCTALHPINS